LKKYNIKWRNNIFKYLAQISNSVKVNNKNNNLMIHAFMTALTKVISEYEEILHTTPIKKL
jgi:hypothetical protein